MSELLEQEEAELRVVALLTAIEAVLGHRLIAETLAMPSAGATPGSLWRLMKTAQVEAEKARKAIACIRSLAQQRDAALADVERLKARVEALKPYLREDPDGL